MFLNFLHGINKKLGTMEARHSSLRIRGHIYDKYFGPIMYSSICNGNAFFCICYWLTFLDLHPSNICKKSMVLYMILFYANRELHLLDNHSHWDLTFADAALSSSPHQSWQLFSIILTCFPPEASALCFSHDQLYVACSRVGKLSNFLCILLKD